MIQTPSQIIMHWSNIGSFWTSIAATLVATSAVTISYLLYRSQSDPDVIVHAEADEGRPSIINLIIENKGNASAHDVKFSWSGKLPARAFGISAEGAAVPEGMDEGPLVHGIPFLPPGGKRVITWGHYWGIYKGLNGNTLTIQIQYRSKRRLLPGYRTHESACPLEILSFEATDDSDRNWDKKIAKNIEDLKESIERESLNWMRKLDDVSKDRTANQDSGPLNGGGNDAEDREGNNG